MTASKKVLIVDDEHNILYALDLLLKKSGFEVVKAHNGKEAVDKFKTAEPDIVLLDIMMPEMDGFEAARQIRALDNASNTKIIFLTAKGTITDRMKAYELGGDDYIVKPFSNANLLEKIA